MYTKIMVPLDGSTAAEMVLPYVEEIAARAGSEILLVSVSSDQTGELDNLYEPYLEGIVTQVEHGLGDFKPKKETIVRSHILTGKAANEIINYAEANDIDLIALASTGKSSEGPWLLGNIAAKVLRATTRPVLLIRRPASDKCIEEKCLIRKVLLPLDGSDLGESAIAQIEALGKMVDIEVTLLHVMEPIVTADMSGLAMITYPSAKQETERESAAIDYLGKIEAKLQNNGLTVSSQLRSGTPAPEIIAFAEENGVDLIAMSTHGRSGINKWVFGSITDKVLHAGAIPVLTVRADGK